MEEPHQPEPALRVALAWQPATTRPALAAMFALDQRLAGVVRHAKEPMLAQIRLAWWREQLGGGGASAHGGEPLLKTIEDQWGERASGLVALVDGWENLLGAFTLEAIDAYASGRARALAGFADLCAASGERIGAFAAGRRWALAEFASRPVTPEQREHVLTLAAQAGLEPVRSRALRGVSVLGGLARRALERGEPLLHGRGAALQTIRLGMLGR